jgi:hypothetical protein
VCNKSVSVHLSRCMNKIGAEVRTEEAPSEVASFDRPEINSSSSWFISSAIVCIFFTSTKMEAPDST